MDPAAAEFVKHKRLAIVGVSRDEKKFGSAAYKELKQRGYQVFPVNPNATTVMGDPCYPDLMSLKDQVEGVVVVVPAAQGVGVLRQAAAAGIRDVWVQQMAESPEVLKTGQELSLNLVTGKCILMYAEPVQSIHKWHRGFMRLIGKL